MKAQRFVDNAPDHTLPQMGIVCCPEHAHAVPQKSIETTVRTLHPLATSIITSSFAWFANSNAFVAVGVPNSYQGNPYFWFRSASNTTLTKVFPKRDANQVIAATDEDGAFVGVGGLFWMQTVDGNPPNHANNAFELYRACDVWERSDHKGGTPPKNLKLDRYIYHPSLGGFSYPIPPTRTVNYHRNPMRGPDVGYTKALRGGVTYIDLQDWDDVVISEVWEGQKNRRMSMTTEFLNALMLITNTPVALGSSVGWSPFDLSFARHEILPVSLTVGPQEKDVREWRDTLNTSIGSYVDETVVFSFKLRRPAHYASTLMTAEGY